MAGQFTVADLSDDPNWDGAVGRLAGANIFASRSWGAYKARIGWDVRRVAVRDAGGEALAYVQYQRRRFGPGHFVLVQGCPLLTPLAEKRPKAIFRAVLDHLALGRLDLLAVGYQHFETARTVLALLGHGFVPIVGARDHTLELDLRRDAKAIRAGMESRWRAALQRAERNTDLKVAFLTDTAERLRAFDAFRGMYADLKQRKGFDSSLDALAYGDLAAADANLLFLEVRERGEIVLVRITHRAPSRWTDFFVASTERGRATDAARLSLWSLIQRAQAEGCPLLDLGGVDPAGNTPVFEFKHGLGEAAVTSNPLWLFGRTALLRSAAAIALARR